MLTQFVLNEPVTVDDGTVKYRGYAVGAQYSMGILTLVLVFPHGSSRGEDTTHRYWEPAAWVSAVPPKIVPRPEFTAADDALLALLQSSM